MTGTEHIRKALDKRASDNNLRELRQSADLVDFCSNDYLGLSRSDELHQKISAAEANSRMWFNGSTGSRLLTGNTEFNQELEAKLAGIFMSEEALLFNSGYTANLALLSSVPQRGDVILYDELSHASIKDGIRLSFAEKLSFKHNDLKDMERLLQKNSGKEVFIVVESIYSMDGDECPLIELLKLSNKFGAKLIVDEAHSTGVIGEAGGGMCLSIGLNKEVFARIFTFGKAMGIHGACVAGSRLLIDYLINFSRPFIYTTAMSMHSLLAIDCAFDYLKDNISLQEQLSTKIKLYRKSVKETLSINYSNNLNQSAIQTIIVPGNNNAKELANNLNNKGYDVRPILSPTVKEGEERIRICLHSFNSDVEIMGLVSTINQVLI